MSIRRKTVVAFKVIFGVIGLGAVINEVVTLAYRGTLVSANFFSYFTIQSNIIAAVALLIGAYSLIVHRQSGRTDAFRGAATLYIALMGVVFSVLLAGPDSDKLTAVPIDNTILHYVMPIVLVIDWLIDRPRRVIAKTTVLIWLAYPIAYLVYSLLRGPIAGWYPYPFLDPTIAGYGSIATTCSIITAGVVVAGFIVRAWSLGGSHHYAKTAIINE